MTKIGGPLGGAEEQYSFSKISGKSSESDKLPGHHLRIETGSDGVNYVKIDSTFEKEKKEFLAKIANQDSPNYATGTEAVKILNAALNSNPNEKTQKAQDKVVSILIKQMATDPEKFHSTIPLTDTADAHLKFEQLEVLARLRKDPIIDHIAAKLDGSAGEKLQILQQRYGVDLKTGAIDKTKL
jgi:hypothetical protein